jgi:tetratricopeptide (TPR) repeat protein
MRGGMSGLFFLALLPALLSAACLDSATALYLNGIRNYDSLSFRRSLAAAERCSGGEAHFLRGRCYWGLQLIAFAGERKKEVERLGKQALDEYGLADTAAVSAYELQAYTTLCDQLMASTGWVNGAAYGPRLGKGAEFLKKRNPAGFFTRFVEAVNKIDAPSFAGGNPALAAALLEKVKIDFPDSLEARVQLAQAYYRLGRKADARREIDGVIQVNPRHLLARLIQIKTLD